MTTYSNNITKSCYLCKSITHTAKFCKSNNNSNIQQINNFNNTLNTKFIKPDSDDKPNYMSGKHKHLAYINMYNINHTTNAGIILRQYLQINIDGQDKLLIEIEEYAQSNYDIWESIICKKKLENEMKNLKRKVGGNINNFLANNGLIIVSKFIIANS
jgi:hypothetical protein